MGFSSSTHLAWVERGRGTLLTWWLLLALSARSWSLQHSVLRIEKMAFKTTWTLTTFIFDFDLKVCEYLLPLASDKCSGTFIRQNSWQQGGSNRVKCFIEAATLGPRKLCHPGILSGLWFRACVLYTTFDQGFAFWEPLWSFFLKNISVIYVNLFKCYPKIFAPFWPCPDVLSC